MVFSPNTFAGAPHTDLATLTFPRRPATRREAALLAVAARISRTSPAVRVKDALEAVNDVSDSSRLAVRGASAWR